MAKQESHLEELEKHAFDLAQQHTQLLENFESQEQQLKSAKARADYLEQELKKVQKSLEAEKTKSAGLELEMVKVASANSNVQYKAAAVASRLVQSNIVQASAYNSIVEALQDPQKCLDVLVKVATLIPGAPPSLGDLDPEFVPPTNAPATKPGMQGYKTEGATWADILK